MSKSLVEATRASIVDSIHRGDVAVVDSDGKLRASTGDPVQKIAYWRSAAKPFQALAVVHSGAAERWGFSPEELALVAGSHNGEQVHTEQASALLAKIDGDLTDLVCGAHPPLDPSAAAALVRRGEEPTALHNNCSGKHIGMLALAKHLTGDRLDYHVPDHPVQLAILRVICDFAGLEAGSVALGIDGCGVPCFGTSVYHLAAAFASLMRPAGITEAYSQAALAVRTAMYAHPHLVGGRDRFDTDLMQTAASGLVAKGGAGGVACVGLTDGVGLAIKIEDGAMGPPPAPGPVVVVAALQQLGLLDGNQASSLSRHGRPLVRNVAGAVVGEFRPVFELVRLLA